MKTRWFDRLLIALSGVLLFALGAFLLLLGIRQPAPVFEVGRKLTQSLFGLTAARTLQAGHWYIIALLVAAGLLLMAWALRQLYTPFARPKKQAYFNASAIQNGSLQISLQALEHLVSRCLAQHPELMETRTSIHGEGDAVNIRLRATLRAGVRMPEIADALQQEIQEYLSECAGIRVSGVKIIVEDTQPGPDEPRLLPEGTAKALPHPEPAPAAPPEPPPMPEKLTELDIEAELAKISAASAPAEEPQGGGEDAGS
jgi:hypothetical protein